GVGGVGGGIAIDGMRYGSIEATLDRPQGSNVWLTFAIREGKNREVKNVLGHLGLEVNRLIRVSFGPFQLADLAPGEIAEVKTRTLREQLGERLIASAGADFSRPIGQREAPAAPPPPPPRRDDKRQRRPARPPRIRQPPPARRGKKRRRPAPPGPRAAGGAVAIRGRPVARPRARRAEVAGHQAHRRPAARGAVQHPRPRL